LAIKKTDLQSLDFGLTFGGQFKPGIVLF